MITSPNENPAEPAIPAFDPTQLAYLMDMEGGDDTTMVKEIAAQFLVDVTAVMSQIEAAMGAGDFSQIARGAHTIKGGAATFGLLLLEKIARQLEAAAKDAVKHGSVPAIYESLREAFATGKTALDSYLAQR